ncbi:uncharacterized protein LOC109787662 [Cajanus cajan]|uniref:uncharacterized protein LOC109787662 n=1 Tax=Cajanus cajan TaxID=3821 RepID=UPI00098D7FD0|nr:uncharacterized protein LOC109787662 [Cajanus cajan]
MTLFEALYGRRCRTPLCWYQDGESMVLGPELVLQTTNKVKLIQERMRTAQSRQKSYVVKRQKPLKFAEGKHVFFKVTPTSGVGRAMRAKKLTPRFIGLYQILHRNFFHDPSHVVELDEVQVKENITYEKMPVAVVDYKLEELRGKSFGLVLGENGEEQVGFVING